MYIRFWNLLRKAESSSQGQLVAQSKMKWFIDAGLSASSIFNRNKKKKTEFRNKYRSTPGARVNIKFLFECSTRYLSTANELADIELNTTGKRISMAIMCYSVYYINTIGLYGQEKSTEWFERRVTCQQLISR